MILAFDSMANFGDLLKWNLFAMDATGIFFEKHDCFTCLVEVVMSFAANLEELIGGKRENCG